MDKKHKYRLTNNLNCDLTQTIFLVQQRYILGVMIFIIYGMSAVYRSGFPLIFTQMVYIPNSGSDSISNDSYGDLICPIRHTTPKNDTSNAIGDTGNRYQWSQEFQGIILSSMFWGNLLSKLPGGILVQKYGGKIILLIAVFLTAIILTITPLAVTYGDAYGLIVTRILIGFLHGFRSLSIATFLIKWYPIEERGRANSLIFLGINAGAFVTAYAIGLAIHLSGRWDIVFYGAGLLTAITGIVFAIFCYDNPQDHPFISAEEKSFLRSKTSDYLEVDKKTVLSIPWKAMLTSTPVLALFAATAFYNWATTVVNNGFPKYINDVLHVSIQENSIYNSVPRIVNIFITIGAGFTSDWMHGKYKMSLTTIRKLFIGLSSVISAIFIVAASYGGCNETLVVILLIISLFGQGFESVGIDISAYDLAPNFIGPLTATVYIMSAAANILAPYTVGLLAPHAYMAEWRSIFWITFVVYILGATTYIIWGSAEVQPWNFPIKTAENTPIYL